MDIMARCLLSGYETTETQSYSPSHCFLMALLLKCLPGRLELGSSIVFWSFFLIVTLDNWRAVILIPYWVCRDLGLIKVGLWGGHGARNDLQ